MIFFTAIEILRNRDIKCDIIKLVNIFPIDNEVVDIMSDYDAVLFFEELITVEVFQRSMLLSAQMWHSLLLTVS